jgi:hypothetical protein
MFCKLFYSRNFDKREEKKNKGQLPLTVQSRCNLHILPGKRVRADRRPPTYRLSPAYCCPAYRSSSAIQFVNFRPEFSLMPTVSSMPPEALHSAQYSGNSPVRWTVHILQTILFMAYNCRQTTCLLIETCCDLSIQLFPAVI